MYYIARVDDLELNKPFKASYQSVPIVLYKTTRGIYAVKDECTHEHYLLSESEAVDSTVECKKHGSIFDLQTGHALSLPAFLPVQTFPIVVEDGKVYVRED